MAALQQGFPAKDLTVIGITGTDGKTTTVAMTEYMLRMNRKKAGSLSTALFLINGNQEWNATQKTSPTPFFVQKFLRRLVNAECTHAVLEYSSHGLDQGRMNHTYPAVAAITNTSPEHLDYHGTMEDYRATKKKLFTMVGPKGTKVLNLRDGTYDLYKTVPSGKTIVYSPTVISDGEMTHVFSEHADCIVLFPVDAELSPAGIDMTVKVCERDHVLSVTIQTYQAHLNVPGAHNIENALCAISCAVAVGITPADAVTALKTFMGVPGRMERIDEGQPFHLFVDFTVTPASYEKTLGTLKSMLTDGQRLLVLTGSCGDRMKEKRPQVGKICSEYADVMVVTNEDPYTEDPEKIIDEVWAGIDQSNTQAKRISERKEAIKFLIQEAHPGDVVILCGKGSDTTMWVKTGQIPWNEREVAREVLRELRNK